MRVPILNYHWFADARGPAGVSPEFGIRPEDFRAQMRWLVESGRRVVPLSTLTGALHGTATLPPRPVVVTFDDGYRDFLEHAMPVLGEFGIPASLFVVTRHIGGTNVWDRKFGEPERSLLDASELRAVAAAGVEVGSHSVDHPDLRTLPAPQALDQCRRSRLDLEDWLGRRVRFLAYPHGAHDARVKRAAREAGYEAACAVLLRPLDLFRSDDFALMRAIIHADRGFANFRLRVRLAAPHHRLGRA